MCKFSNSDQAFLTQLLYYSHTPHTIKPQNGAGRQATPMEPQRRDLAYNAYLKEHPGGNFARFTQLSQAGKRSYGDPTAHGVAGPVAQVVRAGPVRPDREAGRRVAVADGAARPASAGSLNELRRKLAWAVGSVYGIKYQGYNTWPADYARRAAERLVEIHGEP